MHESARLESLGRLSGGIAHDFNNLLSVIPGNARLAEGDLGEGDAPLAGKVRGRLARIRTAGEHAALLTDQMLVYAGKAPTDRKVIDVSRSVEAMAELVRAALADGCTLVLDLEPGLWIEADETQVRQVVLNLVTNAGEALEDGRGRVELRTRRMHVEAADLEGAHGDAPPGPGEYAVLEVSDSGCGMDAETRERIFDPFFTTKFTGRGMGLASVLGIVRAHGGATLLTSEPARGTRVRVLFPCVDGGATSRVAEPSGDAGAARGEGRILVVDDDPDVLDVACEFLRREGFEVRAARGGREAIEQLAADPDAIDAVVLDLSMPGLGGEGAFLEMREIRPALPIVLVSGFSEEFASERFAAPGVADFLRKPYAPEDLVACVRRAVGAD
jgi:CheY-like chemotaxis protein